MQLLGQERRSAGLEGFMGLVAGDRDCVGHPASANDEPLARRTNAFSLHCPLLSPFGARPSQTSLKKREERHC
jgi:hypothetical protein